MVTNAHSVVLEVRNLTNYIRSFLIERKGLVFCETVKSRQPPLPRTRPRI